MVQSWHYFRICLHLAMLYLKRKNIPISLSLSLFNQQVTLKRAVPKELFQEFDGLLTVNRIFVGGLKQEVEESDLRDYFSTFGRVRKIDIMVDRNTNAKRGFAFVEFGDYDPVDKVVLHGNHTIQEQEVTVRKGDFRLS